MIVTLTANPSNDRTVTLPERLERGAVLRVETATVEPGGKGVNVANVARLAGVDTLAVLPSPHDDPILAALRRLGLPHRTVTISDPVRTNITLAEPDGTTTKINEPGPALCATEAAEMVDTFVDACSGADWAVLSGSLPPGVDDTLYASIVERLAPSCKIAVDTSGAPLRATVTGDGGALPTVIKPNAEELADLVGGDPDDYEADSDRAAAAAHSLLDRGVDTVLVTLGASGMLAVRGDGTWFASPLPIEVRSTVGAGDSSLAGWVLADIAGHDVPTRLRWATAYGAAAVSLPGTALPTPDLTRPDDVRVTQRSAAGATPAAD